MEPALISALVKNLEPEFRVRGRAINWNTLNNVAYDNTIMACASGTATNEQIDAALKTYDECTSLFGTDISPTLNPAANATETNTGSTVGRSSTGPSPTFANPLGNFSTK